jgi:NTE family protein
MKIGLALGSGAARGWAHIGIIQALEELGIKVDVMSGCSIGAYVGAAYASGKLPDLAEWVSSLTEWQVLGLMGVGLHRGGLVSGVKVFQALEDNFSAATFEELNIPLAVAAVDLYSGREMCFKSGPIGSAVRASCAIPGLFPPVAHNNRWLVDGAVVNPVPVNLCRQLGADFVIAVNLSADFRPQVLEQNIREHEYNEQKTDDFFRKSKSRLQQWFNNDEKIDENNDEPDNAAEITLKTKNVNKTKIPSIVGVMSSSLEILQARVTRSRLAGDPPDIILEPQLRDFGIMEFYRAQELIEEGRNCVKRIEEQIKYQLRLV